MGRLSDYSPLELICKPVLLLSILKERYVDTNGNLKRDSLDLYEHVIDGVLCNLAVCLGSFFSVYVLVIIPLAFTWHVIVKELFLDAHKRPENAKFCFWRDETCVGDLITRSYGFFISSFSLVVPWRLYHE